METIVTLTLNPALDKSATIDKMAPDRKLRAKNVRYEPGGGGVNVSRAIHKLGGFSYAIYAAGGHIGNYFQDKLRDEGIEQRRVLIQDATRENFMVVEESTDRHYRFGMPGARLSDSEAQECLDVLKHFNPKPSIIVASGSLPPGLPVDFYLEVSRIASGLGAKFVLDTSGEPLKRGITNGVYLLKPNLGELSSMAGVEYVEMEMVEEIARSLIDQGKTEVAAVSLGQGGALLATKDRFERIPSPTVRKMSVVGAGDSMVAGMVLSLAQGESLRHMIRRGVAAGAAATMTPGSELCRKEDADNLYAWLMKHSPVE